MKVFVVYLFIRAQVPYIELWIFQHAGKVHQPQNSCLSPLLQGYEGFDASPKGKGVLKSAASSAKSAVQSALPSNPLQQKQDAQKAPQTATPKPVFKNPLLERREAEEAAKKAASAVKSAAPELPKIELPNPFKLSTPEKQPAAPKPAFKNPLLEKRDAEAAAQKAVSTVKEAAPPAPKFELPNVFEQKPKLPEAPSAPKAAFKNPLLEKREAEAAAKKAVSAVKEAVPEAPKFELPNLFEQKPKLPEVPTVPKPAFKNPLLEKREAEAAAQKAISAVKDSVKEAPKLEPPKLQLPKLELPKPELPKPAPAQKPAFENPLLAKRKAEDALKSAASSASKIVPESPLKSDTSPLKAAAGAASAAGGGLTRQTLLYHSPVQSQQTRYCFPVKYSVWQLPFRSVWALGGGDRSYSEWLATSCLAGIRHMT